MLNVSINVNNVNLEILTAQARALLSDLVLGASFEGGKAILHLSDNATDADITAATNVILSHDPAERTPEQEQQQESAARLLAMRLANATPLDLAEYTTATPELRRLAEKIAWMELEIAARR